MTIEEKMEHFRRLSLESASTQSEETLSSYKQSLDEELELYKESAIKIAEDSKKARLNQALSMSKKRLASSQMAIRRNLTKTQDEMKDKVFSLVENKLSDYRKTPEYLQYIIKQIKDVMEEYSDYQITIYLDSADAPLLDEVKKVCEGNILVYDKEFLGGTKTIIPEKNIMIDNSFQTRLAEEKENFTVTL